MVERISVYGLGKLGSTMLACFAHSGFQVIGMDINEQFVDKINAGESPIYEPGVDTLIAGNKGRISASTNPFQPALDTDASFIIVPTPSLPDGSFTTQYVMNAAVGIAEAIKNKDTYHLVVVTSTVMPGETEKVRKYIEAISGKKCNKDFGICYNPDFIALGRIVNDFLNPDMILIGESDELAGDLLSGIHSRVVKSDPEIHRMSLWNAELSKIALNSYCTMKITFANILGEICEKVPGGDAFKVSNAVGADSRVGKKYFRPGLGYAGPCVKPHALIQTDKGLRRIDELNIGDKVLTHMGRFRRITKIYQRPYNGPMINIEAMGYPSSPIEVTPDHPIWSAHRYNIGKKYRVVGTTGQKRLGATRGFKKEDFIPAYKLEHADAILMPVINQESCPIPVLGFRTHWLSKLPARLEVTPDLMRFFGFYVSEGSAWNKEIKITLHEDEKDYAQDVIKIVSEYFGAKARIKPHHGKAVKVKFYCSNLAPYLKNTFGGKCHEKKIPWEWLLLPKEYLIELMRGLWYGDGSRSDNVFTYGTVSSDLARFVQMLLFRFGVSCSMHESEEIISKDGVRHKKAYFIKVANGAFFKEMNRLLPKLSISAIPKGSNLSWIRKGSLGYNIKSVSESYYNGDVFNLEVDEDNSYVLKWGTVHNCFPRDNRAFAKVASNLGVRSTLANTIDEINDYQKNGRVSDRVMSFLSRGDTVSVLGLTYKEDTTLVEESAALSTAVHLAVNGVRVKVYDPAGMQEAKKAIGPVKLEFCDSALECIKDTTLCFVATPWLEFKKLSEKDFKKAGVETVLDAWGLYDFEVKRIGKA